MSMATKHETGKDARRPSPPAGSPTLEDLIGDWDEHEEDLMPDCTTCNDTGRIVVAADGYYEYLGYDYLPCPNCAKGASRS